MLTIIWDPLALVIYMFHFNENFCQQEFASPDWPPKQDCFSSRNFNTTRRRASKTSLNHKKTIQIFHMCRLRASLQHDYRYYHVPGWYLWKDSGRSPETSCNLLPMIGTLEAWVLLPDQTQWNMSSITLASLCEGLQSKPVITTPTPDRSNRKQILISTIQTAPAAPATTTWSQGVKKSS